MISLITSHWEKVESKGEPNVSSITLRREMSKEIQWDNLIVERKRKRNVEGKVDIVER